MAVILGALIAQVTHVETRLLILVLRIAVAPVIPLLLRRRLVIPAKTATVLGLHGCNRGNGDACKRARYTKTPHCATHCGCYRRNTSTRVRV